MRTATLAVAIALFLALPQAASACVPLPPGMPTVTPPPTDTPAQAARRQADETRAAFAAADIVFRGQVTRVERFVAQRFLGANIYADRATLVVDAVWKGTVGSPMTVVARRQFVSDCDVTNGQTGPPYLLREQQTYLVYAKVNAEAPSYDISRLTETTAIAADTGVIGPATLGVAAATVALPTAVPPATVAPVASRTFPTPVFRTASAGPATREPTASPVATATASSPPTATTAIATVAVPTPPPPAPVAASVDGQTATPLLLVGGGIVAGMLLGIVVARRRGRP